MAIRSDEITSIIKSAIDSFDAGTEARSVGTVVEVGDGIAQIYGLSDALASELLEFPGGLRGLALNLEEETVGAVILGNATGIKEGDTVKTTGRVVEVPVGAALLGRVVDPLGRPLDDKGPIETTKTRVVERIAPGVIVRQSVDTPVQTGIKAIDALIPIGRGQRELIIGDRQTGKTAIAVDAIINQKGEGLVCIYVAIGQKRAQVAQIVNTLEKYGALEFTIVVAATASESAALQYIAPYAGCSIGEEIMENGVTIGGKLVKDALIVYDDLSKHAVAYRHGEYLAPIWRKAFTYSGRNPFETEDDAWSYFTFHADQALRFFHVRVQVSAGISREVSGGIPTLLQVGTLQIVNDLVDELDYLTCPQCRRDFCCRTAPASRSGPASSPVTWIRF